MFQRTETGGVCSCCTYSAEHIICVRGSSLAIKSAAARDQPLTEFMRSSEYTSMAAVLTPHFFSSSYPDGLPSIPLTELLTSLSKVVSRSRVVEYWKKRTMASQDLWHHDQASRHLSKAVFPTVQRPHCFAARKWNFSQDWEWTRLFYFILVLMLQIIVTSLMGCLLLSVSSVGGGGIFR